MLNGLKLNNEMQLHFTYLEIGSSIYREKDLCKKKVILLFSYCYFILDLHAYFFFVIIFILFSYCLLA